MSPALPPDQPPHSPPTSPVPSFHEVGATGLRRSGGLLQEEFNPKLRGAAWFRVATEMRDNEPVLAGAMHAMEMLIRRAPWKVKPKKDDIRPEAHAVAERIDKARDDMEHTWGELISEALNAVVFGVMPFEPVYKICKGDLYDSDPRLAKMFSSKFDDGFIAWRKISPRSPDSLSPMPWEFAEGSNDLVAMRQQPAPDYRERRIPIEKLLLFRLKTYKDSPEGRALFRGAYVPYYFAKRIREIEAIGIERDLAGLPYYEIPLECYAPGASAEMIATRTHFEQKVSRIRRGEYEALVGPTEVDRQNNPTGYRFRLVSSGGKRPADVDPIVRRYEGRELIAFLMEFLTLGQDQHGSYSMHSDKTALSALALGAILDALCDLFNRTEIPRLCRFNGIPRDLFPELTHGDVEKVDLAALATTYATLVGAGALVPTDADDAHFRELNDLPPREDEDGAPVRDIPGINMESAIDPSSFAPGYVPTDELPPALLESEVPTQ